MLSIILKSSIAYINEKEGTAINNKTKQGIKVQIISKTVLCWISVGKWITTLSKSFDLLKSNTFKEVLFKKNPTHI